MNKPQLPREIILYILEIRSAMIKAEKWEALKYHMNRVISRTRLRPITSFDWGPTHVRIRFFKNLNNTVQVKMEEGANGTSISTCLDLRALGCYLPTIYITHRFSFFITLLIPHFRKKKSALPAHELSCPKSAKIYPYHPCINTTPNLLFSQNK